MSADGLSYARIVADAVLYEGYLLYPYRASSSKNQSRWQFGVLGPVGALESNRGEDASLASQFLIRAPVPADATVTVHLRFLQLQKRTAQRVVDGGAFESVPELVVGDRRWLTWDEAAEREITLGPWRIDELGDAHLEAVDAPAGEDTEDVRDDAGALAGRLLRTRRALHGEVSMRVEPVQGAADLLRLSVSITNVATGAAGDHDSAIAASFIGAHLLIALEHADAVSMTDPPDDAVAAAAQCTQHRCWPVLAGPADDTSLMLVSPIILYDHPEVAEQSAGPLFDSTEIDEILTLRVMTLTDEEKAAARATDPKAAQIIDRCDAMSAESMQQLHGILRDPHALGFDSFDGEVPWWDPAVDGSVSPETDEVIINGVVVSAGSIVTVHPSRRADAQDLFFAGQVAKVAAVHSDVDGETHVAVILVDDPAADMHEWYGRYLYFAPDELEPTHARPQASVPTENREESRS
jgi:hypothetical protein